MAIDVSDHAVLRYMQRVHGVDIDEIRRSIAASIDDKVVTFADGSAFKYKTSECTFVVRDNTVTTTIIE